MRPSAFSPSKRNGGGGGRGQIKTAIAQVRRLPTNRTHCSKPDVAESARPRAQQREPAQGPGKPDRVTTTRSRCRIFPRFIMHHSSLIILPGPRPKPQACLFHFRHPLFGLPLCLRVSVVCCVPAFPLSAFRFFPPPFPIRAIRDSWANLIPSQTSATDWQRLGEPNALASSWQPRTNQTLGWPCFLNFCRVVSKVRTCSDGIVRTAQIM